MQNNLIINSRSVKLEESRQKSKTAVAEGGSYRPQPPAGQRGPLQENGHLPGGRRPHLRLPPRGRQRRADRYGTITGGAPGCQSSGRLNGG